MALAAVALTAAGATAAEAATGVDFERREAADLPADDPFDWVATDVNGDGRPDLVVTDATNGTVLVFVNSGGARFAAAAIYRLPRDKDFGGDAGAIAAADLDRDGDIDLAVTAQGQTTPPDESRSTGRVLVLRNNGAGTFATPVRYPTGRQSTRIAAADLNGDGAPDLVTANDVPGSREEQPVGSGMSVLLNRGDGTFGPAAEPTPFQNSPPLALADMDLDGRVDLLSGSLSLLRGHGDGTFDAPVETPIRGPRDMVVTDLDRDGYPDVVANLYSKRLDIAVLRGGPGGRLTQAWTAQLGDDKDESPIDFELADLDDAPGLDLAFADATGFYTASGTGLSFARPVRYQAGVSGEAPADYDGDGRTDLVRLTQGTIEVLLNRGAAELVALSLPAAEPYLIEGDRTVHLPLRCSKGVGHCAGTVTLKQGAATVATTEFDLQPGTTEWMRIKAKGAKTGRVAMEAKTDDTTVKRSTSIRAATRGQRRSACRPPGARTLAESATVHVFDPETVIYDTTVGCMYSSGAWVDFTTDYPEGPFATNGRYVGFTGRDFCDVEECETTVYVFDLVRARFISVDSIWRCCEIEAIEKVVVSPSGSVAWAACAERDECKPSSRASVYVMDRAGAHRVSAGKRVDPKSLRLRGSNRIEWRQNGRTASAVLAGTPPPKFACVDWLVDIPANNC